jgi:glycosyltransferase involved in cell wall biosynthesis
MCNTTIPNKLFDYMAAGLPVLTSDARPAARIVRESGCGEVFRDRDVSDLAQYIERLCDAGRRARCGAAGLRAIARRFHWELDARRLLKAMEETLATARSQQPLGDSADKGHAEWS